MRLLQILSKNRVHRNLNYSVFSSLIIAAPIASAQIFPSPQVTTGAGTNPLALACADLNNDGKLDFVSANSSTNTISLMFGDNSAAGVGAPLQVSVGAGPADVAIGDLNADTLPDIVTANTGSNTLSVLIATSPGVYSLPPTSIPVGSGPNTVTLGDFNNDHKLDIICNSSNVFTVTVFLNNGSGIFATSQIINVGARSERPRAGDLNNDGILDLVVRDSNFSVARGMGVGNGTFGALVSFTAADVPGDHQIIDMNNDGKRDVVGAANGFPFLFLANIFTLPGDGLGGFGTLIKTPWTSGMHHFAAGDFNNDGAPDVVTTHANAGTTNINAVVVGFGNGTGAVISPLTIPLGVAGTGLVAIDYNNDGKRDIACTSNANLLHLFPGDGAGGFITTKTFSVVGIPLCAAVGDLNRDGKPDLIYSSYTAPTTYMNFGDGNGGFSLTTNTTVGYTVSGVALADMNGDFKLDIVSCGNEGGTSTGRVSVSLGTGGTSVGAPATVVTANAAFGAQEMADLNLDGKVDLVTVNSSTGPNAIVSMLGNGAGGFAPAVFVNLGSAPRMVSVGDFNHDGVPDAAVPSSQINQVGVLPGNGAGSFGAPTNLITLASPITAMISDITHDGNNDMVVTTTNGYTFFLGNGAGGFSQVNSILGTSLSFAHLGDVNNDGFTDIVATAGSGAVGVLLGNGSALFAAPTLYTGSSLMDLHDMNSDGRLDAITLTTVFASGVSAVLLNQTPNFAGISSYGTGTPGCGGTLALHTNKSPKMNTPNFGFICTNAPKRSLGMMVVTNSPDFIGSDPFFVGELVHVDFSMATEVYSADMVSDAGGTAGSLAPIPNDSNLINLQYFGQAFWLQDTSVGQHCSQAQYGLVTTRGLQITIQPQ